MAGASQRAAASTPPGTVNGGHPDRGSLNPWTYQAGRSSLILVKLGCDQLLQILHRLVRVRALAANVQFRTLPGREHH